MTSLATITSKNQLTLPKEVIENLDWQRVKKVLISTQRGVLIIKPLSSKVETLAGSLAFLSPKKHLDFKRVRKATQKKVAAEIAREGM